MASRGSSGAGGACRGWAGRFADPGGDAEQGARAPGQTGEFREDVLDILDQLGPLLDEAVGANAGGGIDGARHREDLPALVQGIAHRDAGAALQARLHHHHSQSQAADDAVADGKIPGLRRGAQGEFTDQGALPGYLAIEF